MKNQEQKYLKAIKIIKKDFENIDYSWHADAIIITIDGALRKVGLQKIINHRKGRKYPECICDNCIKQE